MVGRNLLRRVPMPSGSAVAVVDGLDVVAATDGFLVVGRRDVDIVSGLVSEVIDAGEPSLAEIVRLTLETHTEVVDIVAAPPFHAAPGLAEGRAHIPNVESHCGASRGRQIKNDDKEITLLTEMVHAIAIAGYTSSIKALQLQHEGIGRRSCGERDKGLAHERMVGEVEVADMDFIVRHVDVLARRLSDERRQGKQQREYKSKSFHRLFISDLWTICFLM